MDKIRSDEKINNVGALVLNDNRLSKIDLKDFSVRTNICKIAYCQWALVRLNSEKFRNFHFEA